MNNTEGNNLEAVRKELAASGLAYEAELDAGQKNLGAEKSDLEHLLIQIYRTKALSQQTPALLKQAHSRLIKLRADLPALTRLFSKEPTIVGLIERADTALQSSDAFCLDDAEQAYKQAYEGCSLLEDQTEQIALILGQQAEIAALKQEYQRSADLFAKAAATPNLETPQQWQQQNNCALVLEVLGREFGDGDALENAIDLYQTAILTLSPDPDLRDDWATAQNNLGNVRGMLGQRQRGTVLLESSIAAFELALSARPQELVPLAWAETQNNLGNAYGILGQRQSDQQLLAKSVTAFECALEERTQELTPADWAVTQSNLGAVLHILGQHKKDTQMLKKAVDAYKNTMQEWTRERVPLDWATTMNNLATVLRLLGEQRKGLRTLEQSVAAYKNALTERTRERVPKAWAMTQNNLGAALQTLGERQEGAQLLEEAVTAYENALQEYSQETIPIGWAMTMANVGVARRLLAERTRNIEISHIAVANVQAAVDVFRNASHAQYTELGEEQLAKARAVVDGLTDLQKST